MSQSLNQKLQSIPIRMEMSSGNIPALLHEIRHALKRLIERDESSVIDIKAIPLAPGELEKLLAALGQGEVRAEIEAFGRSEIRESSHSGVWVVTHYDPDGEVKTVLIEITRIPQILTAQPDDVSEGLKQLEITLGL